MIEGLSLLPALQEGEKRRSLSPQIAGGCDDCIKRNSQLVRQTLGCGWEPDMPVTIRLSRQVWADCGVESRPATDDAPAFPSVCPGYTTRLPEVIEVARARLHWDKGELTQFCGGQATQEMLRGLEVFEAAIGQLVEWKIENPQKKGK